MRVHAGDVELVGIFRELSVVDDFIGSPLALFVFGDLHGGDAARGEDVGLDVGLVGLPCELLNDATKDAVAEVGIGPVGAGRAGERKIGDGIGDEFGLVPAIVVHHGVGVVVGPTARCVGEEMVDGDVCNVLLVGRLAILDAEDAGGAEDLVREVELALLEEREDGDRGDGFGNGGDAEEAVLLDLGEVLTVGHAVGLIVDELAVARDGNGGGGDGVLAAEAFGDAAHLAALLAGGTAVA